MLVNYTVNKQSQTVINMVRKTVNFMVLTATSQCMVCGKAFPYRKNKQFCSNACKQQAYLSKKSGVSLPSIVSEETSAFDFSLSEYNTYGQETGSEMDLLFYCFLRRNLKGTVTISQLISYFDGFFHGGYSWWEYYESVNETKAYLSFREDFLSSKFTIGV